MRFEPGRAKTGGRQTGTPNGLTGAFKEAVRIVYGGLGGHANFLGWAKDNQTEFYKIASRLIPGEMQEGGRGETLNIYVEGPQGTVRKAYPALEDHSSHGED
jgi:hypothetical protein